MSHTFCMSLASEPCERSSPKGLECCSTLLVPQQQPQAFTMNPAEHWVALISWWGEDAAASPPASCCRLDAWERFVLCFRDGPSGKVTVDDYGARTGKSPGKMRQLNINGDLYVGECSLFTSWTQTHFRVCEVGCKAGHPCSVHLKVKAASRSPQPGFCWEASLDGIGGRLYEEGPAPWSALWFSQQVYRETVSGSCKPLTLPGIWAQACSALTDATISVVNN